MRESWLTKLETVFLFSKKGNKILSLDIRQLYVLRWTYFLAFSVQILGEFALWSGPVFIKRLRDRIQDPQDMTDGGTPVKRKRPSGTNLSPPPHPPRQNCKTPPAPFPTSWDTCAARLPGGGWGIEARGGGGQPENHSVGLGAGSEQRAQKGEAPLASLCRRTWRFIPLHYSLR